MQGELAIYVWLLMCDEKLDNNTLPDIVQYNIFQSSWIHKLRYYRYKVSNIANQNILYTVIRTHFEEAAWSWTAHMELIFIIIM